MRNMTRVLTGAAAASMIITTSSFAQTLATTNTPTAPNALATVA